MKPFLIGLFAAGALAAPASAQLLYADNFDTADNTSFDAASATAVADGRLSGSAAGDILLRSWGFQQDINNNQLLLPAANNGVRFENAAGPFGGTNRFDWAAGTTGTDILASGGFVVEFDWFPPDNTANRWVSFQVGTINNDSGNLTNDDYGILFRQNGDTERFDNSVNLGAGGAFTASAAGTVRKVKIVYEFTSFADGENVTATSSVDGTEVASDTFTWDSNLGEMRMELGSNDGGTRVDNLQVSTLASGGFAVGLLGTSFSSAAPTGELIGTLSASFDNVPETAVFTFAAGDGDDDNSIFQIAGDELQVGVGLDFLNEPDGSQYSVRVSGLGDDSGEAGEQAFTLTLIADADADDLPDAWELAATDAGGGGNLTDLDGQGDADFDNDMLTDFEEWQLDLSTFPGIDPTDDDSDDDTLKDGEEIAGVGDRGPTSPTDADSDDDSLTDEVESNSGTLVDAADTGTDPNAADTDADGYRDAFEILRGGNPTDGGVLPPLSASVSLAVLTDDASTGIDAGKTYTHTISGGGAATINGVTLEDLSPTVTPANFIWDTGGLLMSQIAAVNNGDWDPVAGGVTGDGLLQLFGGFTYSGNGANAGSMQSYTLSGLTAGQSYVVRMYVRIWDTEGSGRAADFSFTNGAAVDYAPILEDRAGIVLGGGASIHSAYAIEYSYVAAGTELVIASVVPAGALVPNGSFHMFGLTNEVGLGTSSFAITGISLAGDGSAVTITFDGQPGKNYALDVATELGDGDTPGGWFEVNDSVLSTGVGSIVEDTDVTPTVGKLFYRLRDPFEQRTP